MINHNQITSNHNRNHNQLNSLAPLSPLHVSCPQADGIVEAAEFTKWARFAQDFRKAKVALMDADRDAKISDAEAQSIFAKMDVKPPGVNDTVPAGVDSAELKVRYGHLTVF